jgi:hypothetical protein
LSLLSSNRYWIHRNRDLSMSQLEKFPVGI